MLHAHPGAPGPLVTRAEFDVYQAELAELRRVRDEDLPGLLRDARGLVSSDAAEEIAQIRDDHAVVQSRIDHLESLLRIATVVDEVADGEDDDTVLLGRTVEVEYLRTGRRATFRLTGSRASGAPGVVSAGSPVGQALLGRRVGEVVSAELPNGRVEDLRISSIRSG